MFSGFRYNLASPYQVNASARWIGCAPRDDPHRLKPRLIHLISRHQRKRIQTMRFTDKLYHFVHAIHYEPSL